MVSGQQSAADVGRIGVVDIGSNSVRLVAYESLGRAPTPIFNDKSMCGLGEGVQTTGRLPADGLAKALSALRRFRTLANIMKLDTLRVIATAAARDAANGPEFLAAATEAIGAPIELLAGTREAYLSGLGVSSGIYKPDGIVGDLGGGSLELIDIAGDRIGQGVSLSLGGLALRDRSDKSPKKAVKIVRESLAGADVLNGLQGRTFYAVGGTWRALARLHMRQRDYPINVMHNYAITAREAADFAALVERVQADALIAIDSVSASRRPLLAYGAVVLDEIIRRAKPRRIVISAHGVREGLLYEMLDTQTRARDPLVEAAQQLNDMRARAPAHANELFAWTDAFLRSAHLAETDAEKRLRLVSCLLFDISWRAHPDYRSEQAMHMISNGEFAALDHDERAFLAVAAAYRHLGPNDAVSPRLCALLSARQLDRAHLLGAAMRVAYALSAAMAGVLPGARLVCLRGRLILSIAPDLAPLGSDRLMNRLRHLARLVGREADFVVEGALAERASA